MIVSAIQLEVIARLGKGAGTTAAQLLPAIDEGNKRIYAKSVTVHERLYYRTDTFDAVSGRNEYTVALGVPSDIKRILKVETRYADQSDRRNCGLITLNNMDKMDRQTVTYRSKERPGYYWFGTGSNTIIGFTPAHDTAGTDYNKVWYLALPTTLSEGSQTPIVPEDAHYLIVEFALAVGQLMEDEDKAGYLEFMKRWEHDVDVWLESEHPGTNAPQFTQDSE